VIGFSPAFSCSLSFAPLDENGDTPGAIQHFSPIHSSGLQRTLPPHCYWLAPHTRTSTAPFTTARRRTCDARARRQPRAASHAIKGESRRKDAATSDYPRRAVRPQRPDDVAPERNDHSTAANFVLRRPRALRPSRQRQSRRMERARGPRVSRPEAVRRCASAHSYERAQTWQRHTGRQRNRAMYPVEISRSERDLSTGARGRAVRMKSPAQARRQRGRAQIFSTRGKGRRSDPAFVNAGSQRRKLNEFE
jgi:hypothetical protein